MKLPVIGSEDNPIHTTQLKSTCDRRVCLEMLGLYRNEATTAMYRGSLAGEMCGMVHERGWNVCPESIHNEAAGRVLTQYESEGRKWSDGLKDPDKRKAIGEWCCEVTEQYTIRMAELFKPMKLIGVELPMNLEIDGLHYESHFDLLLRSDEGKLVLPDFKATGVDDKGKQPTQSYLKRDYQMCLYWLACRYGWVQTSATLDYWTQFKEWPIVCQIHLPSLLPYKRKTTVMEGDTEVTYLKGDSRPLSRVVRWIPIDEQLEDYARRTLKERSEAWRAGIFAAMPEPGKCDACGCEPWCDSFCRLGQ